MSLDRIVQQDNVKFLEQYSSVQVKGEYIRLRLNDEAFSRNPLLKENLTSYHRGLIKEKNPIPSWVLAQKPNNNSSISTVVDIYHVLHFRSQCKIVTLLGTRWMVFEFETPEEARLRYSMISLKTYRFKAQTYIYLLIRDELVTQIKSLQDWVSSRNKLAEEIFHLPQPVIKNTLNIDIDNRVCCFISNRQHSKIIAKQIDVTLFTKGSKLNSRKFQLVQRKSIRVDAQLYVGLMPTISLWLQRSVEEATQCVSSDNLIQDTLQSNSIENPRTRIKSYGDRNVTSETGVSRLFTKINIDFALGSVERFKSLEDAQQKFTKIQQQQNHKARTLVSSDKFEQIRSKTVQSDESKATQGVIKSKRLNQNLLHLRQPSDAYERKSETLQEECSISQYNSQGSKKQMEHDRLMAQQRKQTEQIYEKEKQITIDRVKQFKAQKTISRSIRVEEQTLIVGAGIISKQNNMFMFKQHRQMQQQLRRYHTSQKYRAEQQSLDNRKNLQKAGLFIKKEGSQEEKVPVKPSSLQHSKLRNLSVNNDQQNRRIRTHSYQHAVFPEEIYPINKGFDQFKQLQF